MTISKLGYDMPDLPKSSGGGGGGGKSYETQTTSDSPLSVIHSILVVDAIRKLPSVVEGMQAGVNALIKRISDGKPFTYVDLVYHINQIFALPVASHEYISKGLPIQQQYQGNFQRNYPGAIDGLQRVMSKWNPDGESQAADSKMTSHAVKVNLKPVDKLTNTDKVDIENFNTSSSRVREVRGKAFTGKGKACGNILENLFVNGLTDEVKQSLTDYLSVTPKGKKSTDSTPTDTPSPQPTPPKSTGKQS